MAENSFFLPESKSNIRYYPTCLLLTELCALFIHSTFKMVKKKGQREIPGRGLISNITGLLSIIL